MKKKKKKNKKNKKDFSVLINLLFILIIASAGVYLYITGAKKNEPVNLKEENQEKSQEQPQIESKLPMQSPVESNKLLPAFEDYKYKYTYTLDVQGYIRDMTFYVILPVDEQERQYISDMQISIKPAKIYNDGVNTIAEFSFKDLNTQKINIIFEGIAKVRTYNLKTAAIMNSRLTEEKDLNRYLQPEELIESNDTYITNLAEKFTGETREEIVQKIYEYLQNNLSYKIVNKNIGAKKALMEKYGKCSEYSAAMVALCRAKNIPARLVVGNIAREQMTQHNWVEVWYDEYGWVTYDPTTQPTIVNIYNPDGKLVKQEKRANMAHDDLKYITSGRNKFSPVNLKYSVSDRKRGRVTIGEKIEIQKKS